MWLPTHCPVCFEVLKISDTLVKRHCEGHYEYRDSYDHVREIYMSDTLQYTVLRSKLTNSSYCSIYRSGSRQMLWNDSRSDRGPTEEEVMVQLGRYSRAQSMGD